MSASDPLSVTLGRRSIWPVVWPVDLHVLLISVCVTAAGAALSLLLDRDAWTVQLGAAGELVSALSGLASWVWFAAPTFADSPSCRGRAGRSPIRGSRSRSP